MLGELFLPLGWLLPAGSLLLLSLFVCLRLPRSRVRRCWMLTAFFLPAGLLLCFVQEKTVWEPAEAAAGETYTTEAVVLEYPVLYEDYGYVTLRLSGENLPCRKCRLSSPELEGLVPGERIRITGYFSSARIRYGEETDTYSAKGILWRVSAKAAPERLGMAKAAWRFWPLRFCRAVTERIAELFPEDVSAFITALLTGNKKDLYADYKLYYALSRVGLMHVAAVSGMHVAFLVSFVSLLIPNRKRRALTVLPLLVFFAAATGFTPSVCRAVVMQSCLLLATLSSRESDSPTALALVLAVLLLINPDAAASMSLQLSFAATAGILLCSQRIYRPVYAFLAAGRAGRLRRRLAVAVAAAVGSSCGALLFTIPLMALHFGTVSLISPLSNVLCLWMISLLFTGSYLSLGLSLLWKGLGRVLAWGLAWGARYVFVVSGVLSRLYSAVVYMANPVFVVWLVFAYLLFLLAWLGRDKRGFRPFVPLCLVLIALSVCQMTVSFSGRDRLRSTVLDVGQGECVLFEYGSSAVMVDCGGTNTMDYTGQTAAYYVLSRCERKLDALILTHLHRDHANGVTRLLALLEVETLYLPAGCGEEALLPEILAAAEAAGTKVVCVDRALCLRSGDAAFHISPPLGGEGEDPGLFVRAGLDDFDVLVTGDAGASQERRYVLTQSPPDIEVLVVGHHGSAYATDEWALEQLRPELALISVGYNTYGHPTRETLDKLTNHGIEIHRTDEEGHLTVLSGKEN